MNFTKKFNQDFVVYKNLRLPWQKVLADLNLWKDDHSFSCSVVDEKNSEKILNQKLNVQSQDYNHYGYNSHNTKIWKTTNKKNKLTFDWEDKLCNQLPLIHPIATVTRQDPGQILPWHKDEFFFHKKNYNFNGEIWRFLVFLEDWKVGHHLFVESSVLTHWKQGDVIVWKPESMHLAGNSGLEPKWTCNVTGFWNE